MRPQSCIACDVHGKYTTVALGWLEGSGEVRVAFLGRVETRQEALAEAARRWREVFGQRWPGVVVIEAAGMRGVIQRGFAGLVEQVWQVDAYQVAQLRRGAKTDRRDAVFLAEAVLRGWVKPIWMAPEELEEQRCLVRTRRFLVEQRTRVVNRLRGYARQVGVRLSSCEVGSRRNLERLLSAPWTEPRRQSVEAMLRHLEQVEQDLRVIEEQLEEVYKSNEYAQLLTTLPKCGKGLALTIALEIGDIRRFRSAEALRSYAGLAPRVKESAGRRQGGGMVRQANRHLKWAFMQLAHCLAQLKAKDSPLAKEYWRVRWKLTGHPCAELAARTRMASRLCEIVYAMLRDGRGYNPSLPAPKKGAAA